MDLPLFFVCLSLIEQKKQFEDITQGCGKLLKNLLTNRGIIGILVDNEINR